VGALVPFIARNSLLDAGFLAGIGESRTDGTPVLISRSAVR
jgi:hypothetical protein